MRNISFSEPYWQPEGPSLELQRSSVAGPFRFMNPTTALYNIKDNPRRGGRNNSIPDITDVEKQEQGKVRWNARDYRKG